MIQSAAHPSPLKGHSQLTTEYSAMAWQNSSVSFDVPQQQMISKGESGMMRFVMEPWRRFGGRSVSLPCQMVSLPRNLHHQTQIFSAQVDL
jgi:hypothetical protein